MRKISKFKMKCCLYALLIIQIVNVFSGGMGVLAYTSTESVSEISYLIDGTPKVGEVFNINVNIENVNDLYGASLDLAYDPSVIKIVGIENGDIFNNDASVVVNKVDERESNFAITLKGNSPGISKTSGKLFSIKAIFQKESKLTLKTISDNQNIISSGNNIRIKLSDSKAKKIEYVSEEFIIDSSIEKILPFVGVLDTPKNESVLKDKVNVNGWYLYGKEIERIDILLDGQVIGTTTRTRRDDVGVAYPQYDASKAGYVYELDTTKLTNGNHKLEVKAIGIDGKTDIKSITVNVQNEKILPFVGVLDTPKNGSTIKDKVQVRGWYLYGKEIERIDIAIDGQVTGTATRLRRDDVGAAYPQYDASKAGYVYELDTSKLTNGNHKLEVKAIGIDGKTDIKSITVNVQNEKVLPFIGVLDTPKNGSTIKDKVQVRGWYVYGKEIEKIDIAIDGQVVGTSTRLRRDDVGAAYPQYDASKAGYVYELDTLKLTNGNHKLEVKAIGIDGKTDIKSITVNVQNEKILPFVGVLDTPKNGSTIKDKVQVRGWYVYGKEIARIDIAIDGQVVGTATRSRRDDVGVAYPQYDASKAGYVYELDTSKLTNGNHKLEVKAVGIDGKTDIKSITVNVQNEKALPFVGVLDTPKNESIIKDKVQVRGWYVYGKEIARIDIAIDGQVVGTATRSRRDDVGVAYPQYDASKAGYVYELDTSKLTNGNHKLEVKAIGIDGKIDIKSITISIQN